MCINKNRLTRSNVLLETGFLFEINTSSTIQVHVCALINDNSLHAEINKIYPGLFVSANEVVHIYMDFGRGIMQACALCAKCFRLVLHNDSYDN